MILEIEAVESNVFWLTRRDNAWNRLLDCVLAAEPSDDSFGGKATNIGIPSMTRLRESDITA